MSPEVPVVLQAALVGALVGAVSGGLVAEWRQLLQIRRDARKTLNKVLFAQLEIAYRLKRDHTAPRLRVLSGFLRTRYGTEGAATLDQVFATPSFQVMLRETLSDGWATSAESQYQIAVAAVAEVNPLLAYQLSGAAAVTKYREFVQRYVESVRVTVGAVTSPSDIAALASLEAVLEEKVHEQAFSNICDDAALVARALGWTTSWRVRRLLRRQVVIDDSEFASTFTPLVEEVEAAIRASLPPAV
jgi:hypothetical protein